MKKTLLGILVALASLPAIAQITITAADMPVNGDTLRYSIANPTTAGANYAATGSAFTWNFSTLSPISQAVDTYKNAASVNASYAITISPTAYGYKIADSLPGAPVPVKELYNFFNKKTSPSRYVIEGFAAKIGGFPTPINYSDEDEVYFFPLTSTRPQDNSTFKLSYAFPGGLGSFSQQGTRQTKVDGYGTIITPYTSTPINVLRIRSEVTEIDSFSFGGTTQGIPRNYVEYKWLSNTERYPMLIITTNKIAGGNETVTGVRYRDIKRNTTSVAGIKMPVIALQAFPNPARDIITLGVPAAWKAYTIHVYDATGRLAATASNVPNVSVEKLAPGSYLITAEGAGVIGVARFEKK